MRELRVALFGTKGYAANYIEAFKSPRRENVRLAAAVDPYAESFEFCPLYSDAEKMYCEVKPDIAVIATPIQLHAEQAAQAFEHGCHVVLEKPLAGQKADAESILAARDRAGRLLNVDYQLCYDPAIRAAKRDADAGLFGAPKDLRVIVLWPRGFSYYNRSTRWAGKRFDAGGRAVYDSVLNNATAHYLMNMLFMTGAPLDGVDCLTYRANAIETYDTALISGKSAGADIFMAASHAINESEKQEPLLRYRYERATLCFGDRGVKGKELTARFDDGTVKNYGAVEQPYMENLWNMVDAVRGEADICCGGETAILQTLALESMRALRPDAAPFPASRTVRDESMIWVKGLAEKMWQAYDQRKLIPLDT